jgi:hypothetical protein
MYAVTFPGSISGMMVFLFKETDGGPNGNRPWHRAEHIVRVFPHRIDAENALREYTAWIARETRYTAPECNGYLMNRLKQAAIVMDHDLPERTEGGTAFMLQTSDDQDMIARHCGFIK